MPVSTTRDFFRGSLLAFAGLVLAACGQEPAAGGANAQMTATNGAATQTDRRAGDANSPAGGKRNGQASGPPNGMSAALVVTAAVKQSPFASEVEALGNAKANESVDIVAKVSNRVTEIKFREGQFVHAGDILVELDADEAAADLAVAQAALSDSRSQVNRSRDLFETKVLSAQQMEQLETTLQANQARVAAAKARLDELTIRAPFAGRVGLRNVSAGGLVNSGTVITTLDDMSMMKVDFSVPETFLPMLQEGLQIEATTTAYADKKFSGKVLSVGSRVDPVSRSIAVRGQLANRDGVLKPGMFMTVRLRSANINALVIPEQALVPERDKQFVFAVRDGKAFKTEIVVGRRRPGEVEVLQGLQVGDAVIVEGTQKVRDGVPVRISADGE